MYCKFILYERNNARVSNICLPAGRTCVCVWGGKMMRIAEPAYANTDWKQLGLDDRYSNSSAFWLSNEAIAFANSIFAYMDVVFLLQKEKERFGDAYHIGFNRFENRKKKQNKTSTAPEQDITRHAFINVRHHRVRARTSSSFCNNYYPNIYWLFHIHYTPNPLGSLCHRGFYNASLVSYDYAFAVPINYHCVEEFNNNQLCPVMNMNNHCFCKEIYELEQSNRLQSFYGEIFETKMLPTNWWSVKNWSSYSFILICSIIQ